MIPQEIKDKYLEAKNLLSCISERFYMTSLEKEIDYSKFQRRSNIIDLMEGHASDIARLQRMYKSILTYLKEHKDDFAL